MRKKLKTKVLMLTGYSLRKMGNEKYMSANLCTQIDI